MISYSCRQWGAFIREKAWRNDHINHMHDLANNWSRLVRCSAKWWTYRSWQAVTRVTNERRFDTATIHNGCNFVSYSEDPARTTHQTASETKLLSLSWGVDCTADPCTPGKRENYEILAATPEEWNRVAHSHRLSTPPFDLIHHKYESLTLSFLVVWLFFSSHFFPFRVHKYRLKSYMHALMHLSAPRLAIKINGQKKVCQTAPYPKSTNKVSS